LVETSRHQLALQEVRKEEYAVAGGRTNRTLDVPYLALRFDHRRGGFRVPPSVCVLDPRINPS
jgi:hypothetical protein